jgi:hypothetical protein
MLRAVHVAMRVLVVSMGGILGVVVLMLMVLGRPDGVVVTVAMGMGVRVLMPLVRGVVGVVVLVLGVLGACCGSHSRAPSTVRPWRGLLAPLHPRVQLYTYACG